MPSRKRKNTVVEQKQEEVKNDVQELSGLHRMVPCREKQIENLVTLLGQPEHRTAPCLFLYGHSSCGKSVVTESVMEFFELPHVFVNCIECYITSILFQEILRGLYFHPKAESRRGEFEVPKKCDNMNDFVRWVKRMLNFFYDSETFYIILTKVERLRDREVNLLPALLNLQALTSCNVCVILESKVPWEKYHVNVMGTTPHVVFFPEYTKDDLHKILVYLRPSGAAEEFYSDYVGIVLSVFLTACNDLRELRHLAEINYPIYCEPVTKGAANEADKHKLWKNIEPHLKNALQTLYLREISSQEWSKQCATMKEKEEPANSSTGHSLMSSKRANPMDMVELPFYSKFLLIAAYLASYNPVKSDVRFFVKNAGKNKKTLKSMKKDEDKSAHLKGPKQFSLDRMLAIFYSIVEEKVAPSAYIFSQITSLVSLHLMSLVGQEDQIDCPKYKCIVSLDFIQTISRTVNFDVIRYLYDFV